jgi:hypothetical protein
MKTIEAYQSLVKRALVIVRQQPYYDGVDEDDIPTLSVEGESAVLVWLEYGDGYSERERYAFPLRLLFLSDAELEKVRSDWRAEADRKEKERLAARAALVETQERAFLAALKAKYEPK